MEEGDGDSATATPHWHKCPPMGGCTAVERFLGRALPARSFKVRSRSDYGVAMSSH
jgi:hypothetical protein